MPSEQAICRAKAAASLLVIFREFIKIPSEFTICQSELSSVGDIQLRSAYKKRRCVLPSSKTVKIEKFMSKLCRDVRELYKNVCCARRVASRIKLASPQTSFGVRLSRIHFSSRPWGRNECVTNEPQRTSAGRLELNLLLSIFWTLSLPSSSSWHHELPFKTLTILQ